MRLLTWNDQDTLSFSDDLDHDIPPYVILSHTWGLDSEEVTFEDIRTGRGQEKAGYAKLNFCVKQAGTDGVKHCWVDTCCIDKTNEVELSQAIRSMFQWYKDAKTCYVYMADVSAQHSYNGSMQDDWKPSFRHSRWFTRGWTLQELIAPKVVQFFSREEIYLGDRQKMLQLIHEITTIPIDALCGVHLDQFPINERIRWTENRQTKKKEDGAYCLLGIFNVHMALLYGEGDNAFYRLRKEINDRWGSNVASHLGNVIETRAPGVYQSTELSTSRSLVRQSADIHDILQDPQLRDVRPAKRARTAYTANAMQLENGHSHEGMVPGTTQASNTDDHLSSGNQSPQNPRYEVDCISEDNNLPKLLLFDRIDFRVNNVKRPLTSTCQWLFRHQKFQEWYSSNHSNQHNGFLWIMGKPGCGKSTLMKAALEWARRQRGKNFVRKSIVAYFFNARASGSLEKSRLGLYRTVVHHIISMYPALNTLFLQRFALKRPDSPEDVWTVAELEGFLEEIVESGEPFELCLFIDALDEAEFGNDVRQMIRFLIQLSERATSSNDLCELRICLSSRHYPIIKIGKGLSLVVETEPGHGEDIKQYVAKELTCDIGPERDELEAELLRKSARVFLWVVLVVQILNQLDDGGSSLSVMKNQLETIPEDLNQLFVEILMRNEHGIETSMLLFQWMSFRMRPLEPAELIVAMEFSRSPDDQDWTPPAKIIVPPPDRLSRRILDCSRGLVEIAEAGPTQAPVVQFIHETVREFLLKDGLATIVPTLTKNLAGVSHEILRIACARRTRTADIPEKYTLHAFSKRHKKNASLEQFKSEMRLELPFLDYAILYMLEHAEQAQSHGVSQCAFLKTQTDANWSWAQPYEIQWNMLQRYVSKRMQSNMPFARFLVQQNYSNLLPALLDAADNANVMNVAESALLHFASSCGREWAVNLLLDRDFDINEQVHPYGSALHAASEAGDAQMVQLLLDRGADINVSIASKGTALLVAMHKRHMKIVQILIDKGASINEQVYPYGSVLHMASEAGDVQTVQFLLDRGADINVLTSHRGTALQIAIHERHEKIVQVLLDRGADSRLCTGRYTSALLTAVLGFNAKIAQTICENSANANIWWHVGITSLNIVINHGDKNMVRMLLDKGANVNAHSDDACTALQQASQLQRKDLVMLLLDKGADPNVTGGARGTALQEASRHGLAEIVGLLLDSGADVNTETAEYGNALCAAARGGHEEVVQILLNHGAKVSTESDVEYKNALHVASFLGSADIVEMMLKSGFDVNAQGGYYGNALQAASSQGHEKVVQILLDNNANVSAQGGKAYNALQMASFRGHERIVQLLCDNGANVNAQGGYCGNALQAASSQGHEKVVQILLDNNANVSAQGGEEYNALQMASFRGYERIVQLLCDNGADVNAYADSFLTPLQEASIAGHERVVRVLLDRGAEVDAQGTFHWGTALWLAFHTGHAGIVQLLLDSGADADAIGGISSAHFSAVMRGRRGMEHQLFSHRVKVNAPGGLEKMVQLPFGNGADVNATGIYGTALQTALEWGNDGVAQTLLNNGAIQDAGTG